MSSAPRPQHDTFAHSLLPKLFFANPEGLFDLLDSGGDRYLAYVWERAGQLAQTAGPSISAQLELESVKIRGRTRLWLIGLPEPISPGEALYLGLVYRPARIKLTGIEPLLARYYSLEIALAPEDRAAVWSLTEWTKDTGPSMVHAAGLGLDKEAFIGSVSSLIG